MTQRRRVRALHLASCCTLHTYSIGCTASQRNNIVTIHHTSAVNKTSGSFCHPRSSSLAALTLSPSSSSPPLSFSFYYLFPFPLIFALASPCLPSLGDPFLSPTRTPTTYSPRPPIYLIFSSLPFFPPSSRRPVALFCASHFLSSCRTNHPPTRIFFLSAFPPRSTSIRFPLCAVHRSLSLSLSFSFALVSRVCAGIGKKHPRHESRRLTFCSFVGHRRY